jgi:hypothetical protein
MPEGGIEMSNRRRLRVPERHDSRLRAEVATADQLGMTLRRFRESATAVADPPAAAAATRVDLAEASTGNLTASGGRRYRARLIEGDRWGSSGYWPAKVLERDGPKAFPSGTLMYLNHPTATEEAERPERDVRDLAAQTVSAPVYEGDGLYADVEVFPHAAQLVESLASKVGLSIRGEGTASMGEAAGRSGLVIESLDVGHSVDFVTRAGAGGKLVSLLEAARTSGVRVREARNVEAWLEARIHSEFTTLADSMYGDGRLTREERITLSSAVGDALTAFTARLQADAPQLATRDIYDDPASSTDTTAVAEARRVRASEATAGDIRQALDTAVKAAYGVEGDATQWLWVRDYDPAAGVVWFDDCDNDASTTWQQSYELADTDTAPIATLIGDRTAVFARTEYVPIPAPADSDEAPDAMAAEEAAVDVTAAEAATPDVTDGAPPTAPHPPTSEETGMTSGAQNTGQAPGAAGTTEAAPATSTTVTEATTPSAAEVALTESRRENDTLRTQIARREAVDTARPIASTILAESQLPAAAQAAVLARVIAQVPLTEANTLDETAFRTAVAEAATAEETYLASIHENAGAGRVSGLGTTSGPAAADPAVQTSLTEAYVARGMSPEAAKLAAAGRP